MKTKEYDYDGGRREREGGDARADEQRMTSNKESKNERDRMKSLSDRAVKASVDRMS